MMPTNKKSLSEFTLALDCFSDSLRVVSVLIVLEYMQIYLSGSTKIPLEIVILLFQTERLPTMIGLVV
jgi:hypothetical protein